MKAATSPPIEGRAQLVEYFRSGEKPADDWRVGTEHEKIGLFAADLSPIPHDGERGIGRLLERIAEVDGWQVVREGSNAIALEKDDASITLEPAGQLELSGAPLRTIHETRREFEAHLALVKRVSEPLGHVWLALGIHPFHTVAQLPVMPKGRYRIMRAYLPTRGALALDMMSTTATVQANLDYASESDMVEKMRVALGVQSIVSAIFANSSISAGGYNGYASRRLRIWEDTDSDRCGLLPFAFDPGFGYEAYLDWALDVPMFFVQRSGEYRTVGAKTFRRFLAEGHEGERATLADFELHLTTVFPDVRLKRFLEVRGADAGTAGMTCALPALWKGLLYDAEARAGAWALVADLPFEARIAGRADVARRGLAAGLGGRPVLELAREIARLAADGLRRIGHAGDGAPDESGFLAPLLEVLATGRSPGEMLRERWEGEWQRSPARLIDYARY